MALPPNTDPRSGLVSTTGLQRTDVYCHECSKTFIAQLDMDLNGNHEVECPSCGHLHYRVILGGVVTDQRHNSSLSTHKVDKSRMMWKSTTQPIITSVAHAYIRDRWLNRGSDS